MLSTVLRSLQGRELTETRAEERGGNSQLRGIATLKGVPRRSRECWTKAAAKPKQRARAMVGS
jgi:hypothetical protein